MNRTGLTIALAIAAVVGVIFGFDPDLDLRISRYFLEITRNGLDFGLRIDPDIVALARNFSMWIIAALVAPAVVAPALKLLFPRRRLLISGRAVLLLVATLALGPGLLVNGVLKEYWGRARPTDVIPLGGTNQFVAWWDPRGACRKNCSFVSGDISGAFWTLAPAALAPPPWRAAAYAGALAFGTAVSLMRMAAGSHFVTDAVFAGIFTFLIIWTIHGMIYRWPRTRLSDDAIESAIERIALPAHDFAGRLLRKRPRAPKP
jgi:membrane-associated PAP2 superfamily phosphatase